MFGLNIKDMMKAMQKLGIKQEKVDSEEVVISCKDKDIVIKNPDVVIVDFQGQKVFQISGVIEERKKIGISDEDVSLVAEKARVSEEKAREALEEAGGDIAKALLKLEKRE
ncbi:nascent polypeptide-associated complex protein [Candidatus Woesearchaeota archaeon]|nr:MAG: nascent polypeptide-associated complex protein [Candidatus Woesearchaeota archaeon]